MLYPDQEGTIDKLSTRPRRGTPLMDVLDEYQTLSALGGDGPTEDRGNSLPPGMAPEKLLIADEHRTATNGAVGYLRDDHLNDPAAQYVMMTFVNMYSPGLKILATHRVLKRCQFRRYATG